MAYAGVRTTQRVYHLLPSSKPTINEWTEFLAMPGCEGGLKAVEIPLASTLAGAIEGYFNFHAPCDPRGSEDVTAEPKIFSHGAREAAQKGH